MVVDIIMHGLYQNFNNRLPMLQRFNLVNVFFSFDTLACFLYEGEFIGLLLETLLAIQSKNGVPNLTLLKTSS